MMRRKKFKRRLIIYAGQKMKSPEEADFAAMLDQARIPWTYEAEIFTWSPPLRPYKPDFNLPKIDGSKMHIENKSYLRPKDITKLRNFKKQNPGVDVRFVFSNPNKPLGPIRKDGTRLTHAGWADKHGYPWAAKFLPAEWIKELQTYKGRRKKKNAAM